MRHHFTAQSEFGLTAIENIVLPLKSRDELPPILAGLQWIWTQPALKADIFALLEAKVLAGKKSTGRTGLDLWQILVLGVVRLGLDANYDRLEDFANHHSLIRQFLGVPANSLGIEERRFGHQTLRDNVALLDEDTLRQINARVAAAGREVFKKNDREPRHHDNGQFRGIRPDPFRRHSGRKRQRRSLQHRHDHCLQLRQL